MNDALAERIRWAVFDRVRAKTATSPLELASELAAPLADVEGALTTQAAVSRIELDVQGSVVGSLGLTLSTTKHTLDIEGTELHTWCALDALGIPAASSASGRVTTSCGWCGRTLTVNVEAGVPHAEGRTVLWLPTGPCEDDLREQFCSMANLFCDSAHLELWRGGAGHPPGEALTVLEAADLGRQSWQRDDVDGRERK